MRHFTSWTGVTLCTSLLINGLLAGYLFAVSRNPSTPPPPPFALTPHYAFKNLPPHMKQRLKEKFKDKKQALRPLQRQTWKSYHQARLSLVAEPFNKDRAQKAFAEARKARARLDEQAHNTLIRLFGDLTPEERQALRLSWSKKKYQSYPSKNLKKQKRQYYDKKQIHHNEK